MIRSFLVLCVTLVCAANANAQTCPELEQTLANTRRELAPEAQFKWGQSIAAAIFHAHRRLESGPDPNLHFVARPEAGAWYCGDSDTIYVSTAFLRFAHLGKDGDGAELLAWAIAHELAHRRFDPHVPIATRSFSSPSTTAPSTQSCPTDDPVTTRLEAAADRHAAFLIALARHPETGRAFSPFELSRRDTVASFFAAELGWSVDCPALARRVDAMQVALSRMHELAVFYDTALALAFTSALALDGKTPGPPELLAELHRRLEPPTPSTWEVIPELTLLRAFAHLERAGRAGWCTDEMARHDLVPDPCTMACPALLPRHPALSPFDRHGRRAARLSTRESDLLMARDLIERARREGLSPSYLAGAETCLAYQSRDPERAALALSRLRPENARVRAERRNLATLIALQRHLLTEPAPIGTSDWLASLENHRRTRGAELDNDSPTSQTLARWLDPTPPLPSLSSTPSTPSTTTIAAFAPRPACGPEPQSPSDTPSAIVPQTPLPGLITRGAGCVSTAGLDLDRLALASVPSRRDLWAEACELYELGVADDRTVVRATCPSFLGDIFLLYFDNFTTREATRIRSSRVRP